MLSRLVPFHMMSVQLIKAVIHPPLITRLRKMIMNRMAMMKGFSMRPMQKVSSCGSTLRVVCFTSWMKTTLEFLLAVVSLEISMLIAVFTPRYDTPICSMCFTRAKLDRTVA